MFELKWIIATYEWKVIRHLYFAILFSIASSDQNIWYIYILRVMRCWVTLTMTCIILFCLPGYSIPRSNCSFKKISDIDARMECWYKWGRWIKYIFSLYTLQDYFFCLKWTQILYLLRNNDLQHFCMFSPTINLSKWINIKILPISIRQELNSL